jgi:hypothetical protein
MSAATPRLPLHASLPDPLRGGWERFRQRQELRRWTRNGRPTVAVPHLLKQTILREHAVTYALRSLVETGTYLGSMVYAMREVFDEIHTIELAPHLFAAATRRFARAPHIHVHQGNSADVLPRLLGALTGPALFWLDGHYSGGITARADMETPILAELRLVFGSPHRHVILIDDADLFHPEHGYPSLDEVRRAVAAIAPTYRFVVDTGVIRLLPS